MIFGADKQNKNLKEAAAKTKDTSSRTRTSNAYAARIASSKNNKSGTNAANAKETVYSSKNKLNTSDPIKWSKEGLMDGKSAYIQMNNSGYMNKKLQEARYIKNFESHKNPFTQRNFTNIQQTGIINNYSGLTEDDSSSSRINAISKLNMIWW